LFGWAFFSAIGAKHTTISFFRLKRFMTISALIKEKAGIGGHFLFLFKSAIWANDDGFYC